MQRILILLFILLHSFSIYSGSFDPYLCRELLSISRAEQDIISKQLRYGSLDVVDASNLRDIKERRAMLLKSDELNPNDVIRTMSLMPIITKTEEIITANFHRCCLTKGSPVKAQDRLRQFTGGRDVSKRSRYTTLDGEVRYRTNTMSGGEGKIYLRPGKDVPREALKVSHPKKVAQFKYSARSLEAMRYFVSNSSLDGVISVAQVYERQKRYKWIVKEFRPHSFPLDDAIKAGNPEALEKLQKLKQAIEWQEKSDRMYDFGRKNPLTQKLKEKISGGSISDNIHWDPETNEIFLIDMIGF